MGADREAYHYAKRTFKPGACTRRTSPPSSLSGGGGGRFRGALEGPAIQNLGLPDPDD